MRSEDTLERWREQWGRVRRYRDRLRHLASGKPSPVNREEELDDTYSFFLHCYHLKDWLASDDTFAKSRAEIEDFVSRTPALELCGDVANSVKHSELSKPPRSGAPPGGLHANFKMELSESPGMIGGEGPFDRAIVYIEHKGAWIPVVKIADKAYNAWQDFIQNAEGRSGNGV